jgi:hypothetical protein
MKVLDKNSTYWELQPLRSYLSLSNPRGVDKVLCEGINQSLLELLQQGLIVCEWEVGEEPRFSLTE